MKRISSYVAIIVTSAACVSSENGFEAELANAGMYGPAGCEAVPGWSQRAPAYTGGARNLRAFQYECLFKGGKSCKFKFHWD